MKTPRTSPTEEVHADWWPEGETVTIKTFLSGWDKSSLRARIRRLRAMAEEAQGGIDTELLNYETALLLMEYGVVSTTLTFADGSPVHPTFDDFKRLEDPDVEFIVTAVNERLDLWQRQPVAATQEEAEEARFRGGPADPEGDHGEVEPGGDATGVGGGPASTGLLEQLADAPVDLPQPASRMD